MIDTSNNRQSEMLFGPYIKVLMDHELAISQLYRLLADSQDPLRTFWITLAEEEVMHSRIMEEMEKRFMAGSLQFKRPDFYYRAVKEAIEYIQIQTRKVVNPGFTIRHALTHAIRIEQNMIESRFFEVLDGDDDATRHKLNEINQFNQHHVQKLIKEAGRLRWRWFNRRIYQYKPGYGA